MTAGSNFTYRMEAVPRLGVELEEDPGFGRVFTDHMFLADWMSDAGWHDARVTAFQDLSLNPATAALHYAQSIFEGLKAYAHSDGSVWMFRPEQNAARFQHSAFRLALPALPTAWFVGALEALIQVDRAWVPRSREGSLYLRPFMFGSGAFIGVRPSDRVTFCVIASPVGSYFQDRDQPLSVWLEEEYARAAPGGTGSAKCGANYAAGLLPQIRARARGCDQVVFLDPLDRKWIEELGGMNVFFVTRSGEVVTPELSGSILAGVTRDSILTIAADLGLQVQERRVSIEEWRSGAISGEISEVFACGTASVVIPISRLVWESGEALTGEAGMGAVTSRIREALTDIQFGCTDDRHGWMHRVI